MRDPALNEALKRLAVEAATRLSTLVASGDQVPFDVAEQAGPDSLFHSYRPLTAQYVRDREDELRSLPGFEAALDAVAAADLAAPYLEQRGEPVPADADERAACMVISFCASLWDGYTEFALDRARLDSALAVLEAEIRDVHEAEVLVVPVVGLRMPVARLSLTPGIQVLRADSIDAPVEAMRSEGMGRSAWEPQFLASAEQGEGDESATEALRGLHRLITAMRLFKAGGVGLGPYAFAPTGEGCWRRIATGAPAARPGGYNLSRQEADQLVDFADAIEARPDLEGALAWATARFELGCNRPSALDALSDHLLALRAVFDGQGPVGASVPMRAAALIDTAGIGRSVVRERLEAALELERSLMRGGPLAGTAELAGWVEESVRAMLRLAALGDLGADLGAFADETLIATGLEAGDIEAAVTESPDEADAGEASAAPGGEAEQAALHEASPSTGPGYGLTPQGADEGLADHVESKPHQEELMEEHTRIMEPIPAEGEIRVSATDWLDEVEVEEGAETIEWPASASGESRERIDSPTVRHLFPVPEDAEWEVRELDYDRSERSRAG